MCVCGVCVLKCLQRSSTCFISRTRVQASLGHVICMLGTELRSSVRAACDLASALSLQHSYSEVLFLLHFQQDEIFRKGLFLHWSIFSSCCHLVYFSLGYLPNVCVMCVFFHLYPHSLAVHIYTHHRQQHHLTPSFSHMRMQLLVMHSLYFSTSSERTRKFYLLSFMHPQMPSLYLNMEELLEMNGNLILRHHSLRSRHSLFEE